MIRVTKISNLRKMGDWKNDFHEVWAIVRSMRSPIAGVTQVSELSPSLDLFWKYRKLENSGNWNKKTFDEIYVPQFISELKTSRAAIDKLRYLRDSDKVGKKICLLCFCADETLCHRSIVAGLLQAVGSDVVLDTANNYAGYYDLFRQS